MEELKYYVVQFVDGKYESVEIDGKTLRILKASDSIKEGSISVIRKDGNKTLLSLGIKNDEVEA